MKRILSPLLWPLLWMAVMFVFSTDFGSMENTRSFLFPIARFLFPSVTPRELQSFLYLLRKSAHLTEYAILAILWFFVISKKGRRNSWKPALIALGISCFYAGLDEIHHAFLASRTGSLIDVGIDSLGAIIGLTLWRGSRTLEFSPSMRIKLKYFGWWFAWGIFSSIMLLTITRGGPLSFAQMLLAMLAVGILAGLAGVSTYVWRR